MLAQLLLTDHKRNKPYPQPKKLIRNLTYLSPIQVQTKHTFSPTMTNFNIPFRQLWQTLTYLFANHDKLIKNLTNLFADHIQNFQNFIFNVLQSVLNQSW